MSISLPTIFNYTKSGASYCAQYQTVYNAMTSKPDATNATYQNTLVQALVTAGLWSKADLIYVTAVHTNANGEAYINWANPGTFNLTDPGSANPNFTAYEGFTGDGSSDYLSTNYNVSDDGINASLNSESIAVYNRAVVPNSPTGTHPFIGANSYPNYSYVGVGVNGGGSFDALSQCNASDPYAIGFAVDDGGRGFFLHTRRATADNELYKNGSSINADTETYGGAEVNADFFLLAMNDNGSLGTCTSCQISFVFIGGVLSTAEELSLYNAIQAYMTSLGKQV